MNNISVIIPAFNEELYIEDTIKTIKNIDNLLEIIIVDDGSADRTAEIASSCNVQVIRLRKNMGKGNALNIGCLQAKGQLLALIDADLAHTAIEVNKLIKPVSMGEADMAIAAFPKVKRKAGLGLVKCLANLGIWLFTKKPKLKAPLSGQRVINRKALSEIFPFAEGYGAEVIATIKALKKGLRVMEVETKMKHRETDRSIIGFKHRGKQFVHLSIALFKLLFTRS